MEETERSLHDAIMIVRRAKKNDAVVAGTKQTIFEFHLVLIYFRCLNFAKIRRWSY